MYNFSNPWQSQLQDMQKQLSQLQTQMATNTPPTIQPVTQPVVQQPARQSYSVPVVHGLEGAKSLATTMPYSSSVISMDADELVFYFIATDANGVPTIASYDGVKREDTPVNLTADEYVLKSDYTKLESQVKNLTDMVNTINKNNIQEKQNKQNGKGNNV